MLASRVWTQPQRKWLERIGKQLKVETVMDREALDHGQFEASGGFNHIDKAFDGRLGEVLAQLNAAIWKQTG